MTAEWKEPCLTAGWQRWRIDKYVCIDQCWWIWWRGKWGTFNNTNVHKNSFIQKWKQQQTDCKRNMETETERREGWRKRKLLKLQICMHFCICIRCEDLRNTSKATFWSEPCRPDLHSRGKQHSNMWETESKSGCGRKERAPFHESHLDPVFHLFLQQGDQTVI